MFEEEERGMEEIWRWGERGGWFGGREEGSWGDGGGRVFESQVVEGAGGVGLDCCCCFAAASSQTARVVWSTGQAEEGALGFSAIMKLML